MHWFFPKEVRWQIPNVPKRSSPSIAQQIAHQLFPIYFPYSKAYYINNNLGITMSIKLEVIKKAFYILESQDEIKYLLALISNDGDTVTLQDEKGM
jgi:hypothetical protein